MPALLPPFPGNHSSSNDKSQMLHNAYLWIFIFFLLVKFANHCFCTEFLPAEDMGYFCLVALIYPFHWCLNLCGGLWTMPVMCGRIAGFRQMLLSSVSFYLCCEDDCFLAGGWFLCLSASARANPIRCATCTIMKKTQLAAPEKLAHKGVLPSYLGVPSLSVFAEFSWKIVLKQWKN